MPYYVKVTPEVKKQILPDYVVKPKAKDGNYLLFQSDLIGVPGNTLQERVDHVGGALLTPDERRAEGLGTVETPAKCYTPVEYGGTAVAANSSKDEEKTAVASASSNTETPTNATAEVNIPSVIMDGGNGEDNSEDEEEAESQDNSNNSTKEESEVKHE